ncbi:MAG TPA: TetR/AcrR family transcriptional regulator [Caulobacteraceae bacterium]|nr:TetR/AcrR family transcriptional regulator [Caulobacteraceae bacterium]
MVRQAARREATRGAILVAAERLFGQTGFAGVSVDDIAAAAGVAKGAVYHHFASKEALFEAVFERAAAELQQRVHAAAAGSGDFLRRLSASARAYFEACAADPFERIILKDGPAVLGWDRWRQIDERYFLAMLPAGLEAAMAAGQIRRQPAPPLARLLIGALTEAAVACAAADDPAGAGRELARALDSLLEGLRP